MWTAVYVPVHKPQIVAGDVWAMVGEFDALAAALGTTLALELALQDLSAHYVERIQPAHKNRIE